MLQKNSPIHEMVQGGCTELMKARMAKDPELAERMIPKFSAGCRRISPGDGYLEALQEPNCSANWTSIKRFTPTGIETIDGNTEDFDLIVCATGFNTKWIPEWKLVGKNGATLDKIWKDDPSAFMGVSVGDMPNYFCLFGPNSPVGNGSLLSALGWQCDFVMRAAKKLATEDIK
jgi:cation diffusion facilitator CzcD-associated flavoprotein CzcO